MTEATDNWMENDYSQTIDKMANLLHLSKNSLIKNSLIISRRRKPATASAKHSRKKLTNFEKKLTDFRQILKTH